MADERKIVIEIVDKTGQGNDVTPTPNPQPTPSPMPNADTKQTKKQESTLKSVIINQAIEQAKAHVKQAVDVSLSQYFRLSENYMAENTISNIETTINKAISFGSAIAGGFAAGNVVGATVAGAGWAITEAIGTFGRMSQYYAQRNQINMQTAFVAERAGLTDGNRGTEN